MGSPDVVRFDGEVTQGARETVFGVESVGMIDSCGGLFGLHESFEGGHGLRE